MTKYYIYNRSGESVEPTREEIINEAPFVAVTVGDDTSLGPTIESNFGLYEITNTGLDRDVLLVDNEEDAVEFFIYLCGWAEEDLRLVEIGLRENKEAYDSIAMQLVSKSQLAEIIQEGHRVVGVPGNLGVTLESNPTYVRDRYQIQFWDSDENMWVVYGSPLSIVNIFFELTK